MPGDALSGEGREESGTMETRTVRGRQLVPLGIIARRPIYGFTSRGEAYRLTPDTGGAYLLRRPADGLTGVFATLEEAVAYVATLEDEDG
jgi:hypothetical protein